MHVVSGPTRRKPGRVVLTKRQSRTTRRPQHGGVPGSLFTGWGLGLGGTATPIPSAWVTPGPVRRSVFGQPHLHGQPRTPMPFRCVGTLGKGGVQEGASHCTPCLLWRCALLPFCYPTWRHEILAGSTTGPCIWMMPSCGRLRIFFLPFKGAQFARTLAQSRRD